MIAAAPIINLLSLFLATLFLDEVFERFDFCFLRTRTWFFATGAPDSKPLLQVAEEKSLDLQQGYCGPSNQLSYFRTSCGTCCHRFCKCCEPDLNEIDPACKTLILELHFQVATGNECLLVASVYNKQLKLEKWLRNQPGYSMTNY